ncbi:tail fiber domain-containing protein [Candidatus Zixiibacteriota bacterium]
MNSRYLLCLSAVLLILGAISTVLAAVPDSINYQGILLDTGGDPVTVPVTVVFAIYDRITDGSLLWSESQTLTPDADGRINAYLGGGTLLPPNLPLDEAVFDEPDRWLEITVETDPPMPRVSMVTVAYAYRVATVDGATGGNISGKLSVGPGHTESGNYTFVVGNNNVVSDDYASICGGFKNTAEAEGATVSGGGANEATAQYATVGGGESNKARGQFAVIAGGGGSSFADSNSAHGDHAAIGGGQRNHATRENTTVSGGYSNTASGSVATVCGGTTNLASGAISFIGGGGNNYTTNGFATIAGGTNNTAEGYSSAISGGYHNSVQGDYSCIPGGRRDTVTGEYSLVFGDEVYTEIDRMVHFFDGDNSGRVRINRDDKDIIGLPGSAPLRVGTDASNGNGAYLSAGGTWTNGSSRTLKENFQALDGQELLAKLAAIPVESWNYKNTAERHIGPVAEDFVAAFDVGTTRDDGTRENKYLSHGDLAGVALLAVKALDKKTRKIEELEDKLARLEAVVQQLLEERR